MPKLKTKKGVKKRFRITKSGRIKMNRQGRGHILTSKSESRKRRLKTPAVLGKAQEQIIKSMLPYGR